MSIMGYIQNKLASFKRINPGLIEQVAQDLTYAADNSSGRLMVTACVTGGDHPRVSEVVEAFEGLPKGHPLRRRFDLATVRSGYDSLESWGVYDPTNLNTGQLHRYLYIPNV
jgi:hypothetical protein